LNWRTHPCLQDTGLRARTLRVAGLPGQAAVTSIAAFEIYDGGAGYTSAKHAQAALHRTLRGELLGKPVRLTEIAPGMVETEFSLVRFGGDQQRADAVYEGMTPLVAEDLAEVIGFVAARPSHVGLDLIVIRPRDQASATRRVGG
jgi:NADP-dependent 3-hydroxy acid dehydrogenase YdfG